MTRRFQFSLRAILILMFGVACFLGGVHLERRRLREGWDALGHLQDVVENDHAQKEFFRVRLEDAQRELKVFKDKEAYRARERAALPYAKPSLTTDIGSRRETDGDDGED